MIDGCSGRCVNNDVVPHLLAPIIKKSGKTLAGPVSAK